MKKKSDTGLLTTKTPRRVSQAIGLLACIAAALQSPAALVPFSLTPGSYNADVVVENTAIPALKVVTTASVDNGTNNTANTWYEVGYNTNTPGVGTGLPAADSTFAASSNPNYSFKMAPSYSAPNGILINGLRVTNGTFVLTTPTAYQRLSFLASGGNGGDLIGVIIRHQDGTSETNSISSPDWFSSAIPELALAAGGRINSTVDFGFSNVGPDGNGNLFPRLFYRDVVLSNTTSPVTSIDFFYSSGPTNANNAIFAVSGATTAGGPVNPITVTGYTYDFIVEASAPRRGRITAADGVTFATTQTMDNTNNTGATWYQQGYNVNNFRGSPNPKPTDDMTGTGVPAPGASVSNPAGDTFTFAPSYTANNAVYLSLTVTNATMTFATPTAYSALSFLASAGNGPVRPMVVVHHQNGNTQTSSVVITDWFSTGTNFILGANGRVTAESGQFDVRNDANRSPRLFPCNFIIADTVSPITSIDLVYTNTGGRTAIFAVSGTTGSIPPIFTSQPASVTVSAGASASFISIAESSGPITYQWQRGTNGNFVNVVNGGTISGATTTNLVISSAVDADDADYRLVASTAAGSVNSSSATLTVISSLLDVTQPGDSIVAYQPNGGSSPAAEGVANAINNDTTKYLNFGNGVAPITIPLGFIVTPAVGRTIVSGLRFYAANDGTERDPANSIFEGSNDGGNTWSLISSNAIAIPDTRNAAALSLDPLTQSIRQIRFVNTNGFAAYRWSLTRTKASAALMQIGEVELLGVADASGFPGFQTPPVSQSAYQNGSATFSVTPSGNPAPGVYWLRGLNGSYTALNDGGNISGSHTTSLTINPLAYSDAQDYVAVVTNISGSVTSAPARLTVISPLLDVTSPSDIIVGFGDQSGYWGVNSNAVNAIDDNPTVKYQNGGSGFNSSAAFPPFVGPAGLIITPAAGATRVTGLRVYTADANEERDPSNYVLEGSNDGGASYNLISSGSLNLPVARSSNLNPFDPLVGPLQEVLFANNSGFTTYRLTFNSTKNNNTANSLQIGEIELLGVASGASPTASVRQNGNGTLTLTTSAPGTLQSATNLISSGTVWQDVGPITDSVIITPQPNEPVRFYRILVP